MAISIYSIFTHELRVVFFSFIHVYLHFTANCSNIILAESEDGNQGTVTIHGGGEKANAPRYFVGSVTENNVGRKESWLWVSCLAMCTFLLASALLITD